MRYRRAAPRPPLVIDDGPHWTDPWVEGWHEHRLLCMAPCCRISARASSLSTPNEERQAQLRKMAEVDPYFARLVANDVERRMRAMH